MSFVSEFAPWNAIVYLHLIDPCQAVNLTTAKIYEEGIFGQNLACHDKILIENRQKLISFTRLVDMKPSIALSAPPLLKFNISNLAFRLTSNISSN